MSRFLNKRYQSLEAYTPGEQPRDMVYIKLNTNESPYPPAPSVVAAMDARQVENLRLYSERVCRLQPKAVILREKDLSEEEYLKLAEEVLEMARKYKVECRLHFYWEVALTLEQSAIHLPLWKLREMKEEDKKRFAIIGTSIHSVEEAREAQMLGSTYLTAGHIYTTDCKKGVAPRGIAFLQEVCSQVSIPVYAIGGIHVREEQIAEVMDAGASGGCVMSGMMTI